MWRVNPALLCRKHLLGAHVETHMLAGSIRKGHNLAGFIDGGLVDLSKIQDEHNLLADEMTRRGYRHGSPLIAPSAQGGAVDKERSLRDLSERCQDCRARIGVSA
jgi:hypothetical protein